MVNSVKKPYPSGQEISSMTPEEKRKFIIDRLNGLYEDNPNEIKPIFSSLAEDQSSESNKTAFWLTTGGSFAGVCLIGLFVFVINMVSHIERSTVHPNPTHPITVNATSEPSGGRTMQHQKSFFDAPEEPATANEVKTDGKSYFSEEDDSFSSGFDSRLDTKLPINGFSQFNSSSDDKKDSRGKYIGNLTANPFASTQNEFDPNSVTNDFGKYGSEFSQYSATNPFTYDAPKLYDQDGNYRGKLSSNEFDPDSISNPFGKYGSEFSSDSINNEFGAGSPFKSDSPNNPFSSTGWDIVGQD